MEKLVVYLPPVKEQHRIVAKVDELMALCDQLETQHSNAAEAHEKLVSHLLGTLTQSPKTGSPLCKRGAGGDFDWQRIAAHFDTLFTTEASIDALKQTLLQLAVMGKLVPQDPNDEPASELLKRIQAGAIKKIKLQLEMKDQKKPFELPHGWEWVNFGAVSEIERGGSPRPIKSFITNDVDGLNWIKIGDTNQGGKYIISTNEKIRKEGLSKTRMVYLGDFLLTNSMSFGRPYITKIVGCIHDGWLRITPPEALDKDFLYYLISSSYIRKVFIAAAAGAVVMNLNADKVRDVLIPVPPLGEQYSIVAKVDELMAICDQLKSRITEASQLQKKLADVLVEQATA